MFYLFYILIQMKILLNNKVLFKSLRPFDDIGFVPTMGGIHEGHLSLINRSKKICNKTIVSIFINPKQFNNKKDFLSYPSNLKKDLSILKKSKKVDFVYIPKLKDIYKNLKKSKVSIVKKDRVLCAKYREGHFEGVLDVMDKLTFLIKPKKIFMGKKDFQQLYLVKNFLKKHFKTKVVACRTIRNSNGVALSSRNFLLNKFELNKASKLIRIITKLKKQLKKEKNINKFLDNKKKEIQKELMIEIEYLELRKVKDLNLSNKINDSKVFLAYYIGDVRLIDNF